MSTFITLLDAEKWIFQMESKYFQLKELKIFAQKLENDSYFLNAEKFKIYMYQYEVCALFYEKTINKKNYVKFVMISKLWNSQNQQFHTIP